MAASGRQVPFTTLVGLGRRPSGPGLGHPYIPAVRGPGTRPTLCLRFRPPRRHMGTARREGGSRGRPRTHGCSQADGRARADGPRKRGAGGHLRRGAVTGGESALAFAPARAKRPAAPEAFRGRAPWDGRVPAPGFRPPPGVQRSSSAVPSCTRTVQPPGAGAPRRAPSRAGSVRPSVRTAARRRVVRPRGGRVVGHRLPLASAPRCHLPGSTPTVLMPDQNACQWIVRTYGRVKKGCGRTTGDGEQRGLGRARPPACGAPVGRGAVRRGQPHGSAGAAAEPGEASAPG